MIHILLRYLSITAVGAIVLLISLFRRDNATLSGHIVEGSEGYITKAYADVPAAGGGGDGSCSSGCCGCGTG